MSWRAVVPVLFAIACDSPITVSSGSALQVSWDVATYTHLPALLVITIDDGNDADAIALRSMITHEGLVSSFDMLLLRSAPWVSDPASGSPGDAQIVIVHPRSGTFVTPLDDPRLRLSGAAPDAALDSAADAVIAHAQEGVVAEDSAYALIARTRDVVSLLLHERAARDARETAAADAMPDFRTVTVTMVTSRDDASRTRTMLLPPSTEADRTEYMTMAPCISNHLPSFPNLEAWSKTLMHASIFSWVSKPYCGDPIPIHVFEDNADYGCNVLASADGVARTADGAAECSITFDSTDISSCDPSRGWADPIGRDGIRRPWFDDVDGFATRRCEILQLTGAARTSCEQSVACEGCSPGFCATTLLDESPSCPSLARFVGSSLPYANPPFSTKVHFTCNLR